MKRLINKGFVEGMMLVLFVSNTLIVSGQELAVKESPTLDFTYLKKSDGSKLLTATLTIFRNRITYPIVGSKITFFLGTDTSTVVIPANADGKAYLIVQPGAALPVNKDGFTKCVAAFGGNDTLESVETTIAVKDAVLKMSLDLVDSVKTVTVWAFIPGNDGDSIPLAGETVNVYVERMFSPLKIGEGTFDEGGRFTCEFPPDLPGEADGTVRIIARIEENEQYANIENERNYPWGVPSMHGATGSHRALWTEIAPMWMIITLTILLLGVWGHYIYAIIQLILIKRESKKLKL
jgi:hypothetical protein